MDSLSGNPWISLAAKGVQVAAGGALMVEMGQSLAWKDGTFSRKMEAHALAQADQDAVAGHVRGLSRRKSDAAEAWGFPPSDDVGAGPCHRRVAH